MQQIYQVKSMSIRKLIKEAAAAVIKAENAQNSFRETFSFVSKRNVSSLPDDILAASRRAKYPTRKQPSGGSTTPPPFSPPASAGDTASQQQMLKDGAKIGRAFFLNLFSLFVFLLLLF